MAEEQENIKLNFDSNAKQVAGDVNKLGASIESSTVSTKENNQAVEQGNQSYKTFKTQLREANQELQKSIQLYGETSEQTIKAAKEVANLKDQMGFAQDISDKFNPDQKMKALGAATQLAGTGLQGVTAGMALFGGESEDTQKQLLKVQAAMAFSDAISGLSNLGDQWKLLKATITSSSIATKANTAATGAAAIVQNLFTGSVNTSSAGFKGLKLAIAGTGVGLLVVGLALLVTNFSKIKDVVLKVVPGLAAVGKFIGSIVESVTDFIGVTSEADRVINKMKANADNSIALNKKFLAEHGSQLDEFTKQKIEAKNKYNEAIKEDGADQIALAKELSRELAQIEYSRGDDYRKIQKENSDKAKEDAEKRKQQQKEDAEKKAKEDADALKKSIEEQAKNEADLKQKIVDAIDVAQEKNNEFRISAQQKEIQDVNDKYFTLIENAKKFGLDTNELEDTQLNERNEINLKYQEIDTENKKKKADEDIEIEKAVAEQKKSIQEGQINLADSAVGFLSRIAGKNKTLQKAAIIAESALGIGKSIIATNASNVAATSAGAALAIPTAGASVAAAAGLVTTNYVSLGLGVAGNIAATAKALQALGGGSAPSAGSTGGGARASIAPPSVAFNNTAENQIGRSVSKAQGENPPIQVVVAESDITKAQGNVKVLVEKNTF
ncbi:hypothetical protein [Flavobacterium sp.]|uniref:hypothetical protein n=1 Tax=Flavobacterium sp. TaxID=239 RepID=UPI0038FC34B7